MKLKCIDIPARKTYKVEHKKNAQGYYTWIPKITCDTSRNPEDSVMLYEYDNVTEEEALIAYKTDGIASLNYHAESNTAVIRVSAWASNLEPIQVNKEEIETELEEAWKDFNKTIIEANEELMNYCNLHNLVPEESDVEVICNILYPMELLIIHENKILHPKDMDFMDFVFNKFSDIAYLERKKMSLRITTVHEKVGSIMTELCFNMDYQKSISIVPNTGYIRTYLGKGPSYVIIHHMDGRPTVHNMLKGKPRNGLEPISWEDQKTNLVQTLMGLDYDGDTVPKSVYVNFDNWCEVNKALISYQYLNDEIANTSDDFDGDGLPVVPVVQYNKSFDTSLYIRQMERMYDAIYGINPQIGIGNYHYKYLPYVRKCLSPLKDCERVPSIMGNTRNPVVQDGHDALVGMFKKIRSELVDISIPINIPIAEEHTQPMNRNNRVYAKQLINEACTKASTRMGFQETITIMRKMSSSDLQIFMNGRPIFNVPVPMPCIPMKTYEKIDPPQEGTDVIVEVEKSREAKNNEAEIRYDSYLYALEASRLSQVLAKSVKDAQRQISQKIVTDIEKKIMEELN